MTTAAHSRKRGKGNRNMSKQRNTQIHFYCFCPENIRVRVRAEKGKIFKDTSVCPMTTSVYKGINCARTEILTCRGSKLRNHSPGAGFRHRRHHYFHLVSKSPFPPLLLKSPFAPLPVIRSPCMRQKLEWYARCVSWGVTQFISARLICEKRMQRSVKIVRIRGMLATISSLFVSRFRHFHSRTTNEYLVWIWREIPISWTNSSPSLPIPKCSEKKRLHQYQARLDAKNFWHLGNVFSPNDAGYVENGCHQWLGFYLSFDLYCCPKNISWL